MKSYPRRAVVQAGMGMAAAALTGCGRTGTGTGEVPDIRPAAMLVHRDPGCGCCEEWARLAEAAGYRVTLRSDPDMPSVKQRLGVPPALAACHTAQVDDWVIEGHVPFEQIDRVRRTRPEGVLGLAVPGMPPDSPGMETGSGVAGTFEVLAFDRDARVRLFASYPDRRSA